MRPATLEEARAARAKLAALLEGVEEVRGLGIAMLSGGYGVKLNLASAVTAVVIPPEIDGVPVVVEVVGEVRQL